MTAKKIRKLCVDDANLEMLREIAAQLAEHNEILRQIHPELNMPEECRRRTCDYHVCYLAYGGPDMSHEAYHAMCELSQAHSKHCTYNGPKECPSCLSYEKRLRA